MKMADVLFFLQRHSTTNSNKKDIYRSWSNAPDAQLNAQGRRESKEAGEFYKKVNAPLELIIMDTLDRVIESMELTAQTFGSGTIKFEMVRALHPLNMGDYTGKSKATYPVEPFLKDKDKVIPGGENVRGFDHREEKIFNLIYGIARDNPGGHLIVGAHGSNVAYLWNNVYHPGEELGYEGLVDPGGVIAVTEMGMYPLTRVRDKKPKGKLVRIADYDPKKNLGIEDPDFGVAVPWGGSNCAKCEYLDQETRQDCNNKDFIAWQGGDRRIHGEIEAYCCNEFEAGEEKKNGNTGSDT